MYHPYLEDYMKRSRFLICAMALVSLSPAVAQSQSLISGGGLWSQGDGPRGLGSIPGRICYLQYLTGKLESGLAWTGTGMTNGNWVMTGAVGPSDRDVSGGAYCINVPGYGGTTATWRQGNGEVVLGSVSDRICVLTAVGGRFAGGGDGVYIRRGGRHLVSRRNWSSCIC